MHPSKTMSAAIVGLDAKLVEVEVFIDRALAKFFIVGLADTAIQEAKDRVRSAIKNSGFDYPLTRITANLAPADLKKDGPSYDLPIAIGVLAASGQISPEDLKSKMFVGELSLEGKLRHVNGVLPVAIAAKDGGIEELFVPRCDAAEASVVEGVNIVGAENLKDIVNHICGRSRIEPVSFGDFEKEEGPESALDFRDVKGQEQAKRALEIAAAGGHNVLFTGPPGSGKTMLARTFVSILPRMQLEESLEITKIHSIAGVLPEESSLIKVRPFRAPHHTASGTALVGGGTWPRPGEISLAHRGVLFLDEFPEFPRAVLENLRQPLEDGIVTISRAQGTLTFPAKFILIASMNPCPCGFLGDEKRGCTCTPFQIQNYTQKISGPLLDRIDLHLTVPRVEVEKLKDIEEGKDSRSILARVERARAIQKKRFRRLQFLTNAEMGSREVAKFCELDARSEKMLLAATEALGLSARAYFRILKLARTIADLEGIEDIKEEFVAEALQYRSAEQQ